MKHNSEKYNELATELKHNEHLAHEAKDEAKKSNIASYIALGITGVMAILTLVSVILEHSSETKYRNFKMADSELNRQIKWERDINLPMVKLREVNEEIIAVCKNKLEYDRKNFLQKIKQLGGERLKYRAEIVYASFGAEFIFSREVADLMTDLVKFDESKTTEMLCKKNPPDPNMWKQKQVKINKLIHKILKNTQAKYPG